jgi:hypothetical protein
MFVWSTSIGKSLLILFLLTGAFLALAIVHSPWWWLGVALAGWQIAGRWYTYFSRRWRRIHFPFMRAYAWNAGVANAFCEENPFSEASLLLGISLTIKQLFPTIDEEEIESFVKTQWERCRSLTDLPAMKSGLRERARKTPPEKLERAFEELEMKLSSPDNSLLERFAHFCSDSAVREVSDGV